MRVNPDAVVKALGRSWLIPLVHQACVVTTTMRKAGNALGGVFRSSPGALLLPATDGSNCAETHVSQALIIYAVCCMLLSKVPCGAVSAYIFGMSGARGTKRFHHNPKALAVVVSSTMNPLSLSASAGR